MKTKINTGLIAILLMFAFSCQKDAATNAQSSNSTDRTSQSVPDATVSVPGLVYPPGDWILYYSWECTGSYSSTTMHINEDGSWSNGEGYTGKWVDGHALYINDFDGTSKTTYSGTERLHQIVGIMTTFADFQGCFYMLPDDGRTKTSHVPDTPDAAGNLKK